MNYKEAIQRMREMTARDETFSFKHQTYSAENGSGGFTRVVERATVRSSPSRKSNHNIDPDMLLEYRDHVTGENRRCYKLLIIEFQGEKVTIQ